ncbi:MAG TPA: hypothetical protein EYN79_10195 [Planctomycetes bacterium]|nr:hypothetical protein [Planctomycetota bacterium]
MAGALTAAGTSSPVATSPTEKAWPRATPETVRGSRNRGGVGDTRRLRESIAWRHRHLSRHIPADHPLLALVFYCALARREKALDAELHPGVDAESSLVAQVSGSWRYVHPHYRSHEPHLRYIDRDLLPTFRWADGMEEAYKANPRPE